jgi:hypothetical protein
LSGSLRMSSPQRRPVLVDSGEALEKIQRRQLIFQMSLVQGDQAVGTAVIQRVDARVARRASVTAPMGDEEDIAVLAEKPSQLGLRAGPLFAAVVVENGRERTATCRRVDEPAKLEFAARERDLLRLGGDRRGGKQREQEGNEMSDRRYAFCFSASSFCSSPDWYISRMMSEPPTNSPFT